MGIETLFDYDARSSMLGSLATYLLVPGSITNTALKGDLLSGYTSFERNVELSLGVVVDVAKVGMYASFYFAMNNVLG